MSIVLLHTPKLPSSAARTCLGALCTAAGPPRILVPSLVDTPVAYSSLPCLPGTVGAPQAATRTNIPRILSNFNNATTRTHGFSFGFAYLSVPIFDIVTYCYLSIPTRTLRFPILYAYVLCHSPYALCFHVSLSTPRTIMNPYLMHTEIFSPICQSIRFSIVSGEDVMIQTRLLDGTHGTIIMSLVAQLVNLSYKDCCNCTPQASNDYSAPKA